MYYEPRQKQKTTKRRVKRKKRTSSSDPLPPKLTAKQIKEIKTAREAEQPPALTLAERLVL